MVRAELRGLAAAHVNAIAEEAAQFYDDQIAQEQLTDTRDAAVAELRDMAVAFAEPVMAYLEERGDLDPNDYAALTVVDPEDLPPNTKSERQPGTGAGRLWLDINLRGLHDLRVIDVLPLEGEEAPELKEVTGVAIRPYWELVTPTKTHSGYDVWQSSGPMELYGLTSRSLVEAATIEISIPPRPEEIVAVEALVEAVSAQRRTFDETWDLFQQFNSGVVTQAPVPEEVAPEEAAEDHKADPDAQDSQSDLVVPPVQESAVVA